MKFRRLLLLPSLLLLAPFAVVAQDPEPPPDGVDATDAVEAAQEAEAPAAEEPPLQVIVVPPPSAATAPSPGRGTRGWEILGAVPAPAAPGGEAAAAAALPPPPPIDEDLLTGYRRVLDLLAGGREEEAGATLAALEIAAFERHGPAEIRRLFDTEVEMVREIGLRDLESVVPLIALHHDSYHRYLESGHPYLASHASKITASLADLYARRGEDEGSRRLAANVLSALGIYARQTGMKLGSARLLLHGLGFDPDNEAGLLGMAALQEWNGGYEQALEHLERLVAAYPEHREGRLRRAINLVRLERRDEGRRLLLALVAEPADDWVAVVAYQEAARLELAAERARAAATLLEQAVERFPDEHRLHVQLAFALDRAGEPARSAAVLEEIAGVVPPGARSGDPPPRRLYGMGPQEAYQRALQALAESATDRLPRLASALGGGGQAPAGGGA